MKQPIYNIFLGCLLLLLPGVLSAQDIVGPDDPTDPSTGDKTITVTQRAGGTISPLGTDGKVTVHSGTDQTFIIRPNAGFEIASVLIDDKEEPLEDADRLLYSYKFTNIIANHTITATFRSIRFTLTAEASKGGSIIPLSSVVPKGSNQLFTLTADKGYEIADLKVDGVSVGAPATYTLDNVTKDTRLEALFQGIRQVVKWENPENGSLKVTLGDKELASGDKVTYGSVLAVTPVPGEGYGVGKLTANGRLLTTSTCLVEGDLQLAVTFNKRVYPVTVAAPENGRLTVKKGAVSLLAGVHQIEYGTKLTLESSPLQGYSFSAYQVTPEAMLTNGEVTVTGAVTINASFVPLKYRATITAPETTEGQFSVNGKTAVSGEEEYPYGTILTLGNTPSEGKLFDSYKVTPTSALSGSRVTITGDVSIAIRFKSAPGGETPTDPEDGKKLYAVTFSSPLTVRNGETSIGSGNKVKEGTLLSLVAPNTNSRRMVSLTANGNPMEFLTSGGLNTAVYEVKSAVSFAAGFENNTFPIVLHPSNGGVLQVQAGGTAIVSGNRYAYGTTVTATATPAKGYTLTRILAGGTDITVSRRITLTEDLILSAVFTKENELKPNPDPADPDPNAPAGIDLTPQSLVYNGKVQAFEVRSIPGGIVDKVSVSYKLNGRVTTPRGAGLYDVTLNRAADDRFAALNETIPGGLEIRKAAVTLTSVDYEEEPQLGTVIRTTATLKGGKAVSQNTELKGSFTWSSPEAIGNKLTLSSSGYEEVRFTPDDAANYQTASARVRIQVGEAPAITYKVTIKKEGEGSVSLFSGDLSYPASGPFYEGMSLTLKATAGEGYRFAGFLADGVLYEVNPYTLTVSKDKELTARFVKKTNPSEPSDPSDPSSPPVLKVKLTLPTSLVYDGKPRLAAIESEPSLNGWQVEYRNKEGKSVIPVDADPYEVIVTRKEDDTYLAYKETASFTILRATPVISKSPETEPLRSGALLEDARLIGGEARTDNYGIIPGHFEWSDPRKTITVEGKETYRFTPLDAANFYTVSGELEVKLLPLPPVPVPILITYDWPSGGTLKVKYEDTGSELQSGSLIPSGTRLRIEAKAATYFKLEGLRIGSADYTSDAINGKGTVVRSMFSPAHITATFLRTSYPPDPDPDPDPEPEPTPDPDPKPEPTPDPDYTVWVKKTGLGSITPETQKVKEGESLSFTITPGYSQQIVDVRLNGNSVGAVTVYTLRNIDKDATIEAVFSNIGIPVYTLTSKTIGNGGSITPATVRVAEGSNHQFVIHTNGGSRLMDVQIGTKDALKSIGTPGSYIFQGVKADSLIVATFPYPTGIEEVKPADSRLYATGTCLYATASKPGAILRIYTLSGSLYLQRRLAAETAVQLLPEGLYVAELVDGSSVVRVKVKIKE